MWRFGVEAERLLGSSEMWGLVWNSVFLVVEAVGSFFSHGGRDGVGGGRQ